MDMATAPPPHPAHVHLQLAAPGDLHGWRALARAALDAGLAPHQITWSEARAASGDLLSDTADSRLPTASTTSHTARVPKAFLELAESALCHRSPARLALLYRVLWRLQYEQSQLLAITSDPDIAQLHERVKAVSRDSHKMKAFVRFREVVVEGSTAFVAWFEPDHRIVRRVAPFFARRFAGMRWSILTPDDCAHWSGSVLSYTPGTQKPRDHADALEDLWRTYYAHIFNPARLNVPMMQKEMPQKYWKHLPEAQLIPQLVQGAMSRTGTMINQPASTPRKRIAAPTASPTPIHTGHADTLSELHNAIRECRRCPLWQDATQAVPGGGPAHAQIMLVGEQPGDQEDLGGAPFIGPAGRLLDRLFAQLRVDRNRLYLTNAVKHFKFQQRGLRKLRLHQRADASEQAACRPWLAHEIELLRPRLIVCLGVTAAQAVLGRAFVSLTTQRGQLIEFSENCQVLLTLHPAALLRMPESEFAPAWAAWIKDWHAVSAIVKESLK
jgi:DNA polymerase